MRPSPVKPVSLSAIVAQLSSDQRGKQRGLTRQQNAALREEPPAQGERSDTCSTDPAGDLTVSFQQVVHPVLSEEAEVANFSDCSEDRMNIHKNARLTPLGRERLVRAVLSGQRPAAAARAAGVCSRTACKWVERYRREGLAGLADRSSRPYRMYRPTPAAVIQQVETLRRERWTGQQIAAEVGVSPATVSRILRRVGLNRISALEPAEPVRRYERQHPGELIHLDIKKLGRFERVGHRITGKRTGNASSRASGWEFVHVCIDDASRLAFSQILPDEKKESAVAFLKAAVAYYQSLGVAVARVMTDNGSCYRSKAFRKACSNLGLRHIFTKPYTPKTNGKAERFIQTALREWAYAQAYPTSDRRADELPVWLHRYNWHRPHGSLKSKPPISRLALDQDNLLRLHI
jgi:transposase InsO family protein